MSQLLSKELYSVQRAKALFGGYRRGDANDPELYVASIAAVLAGYDMDLIREVTDPRTGISTDERYMTFMPNSGELKSYCDGVAARRLRIAELGALPGPALRLPAPPAGPGDWANVLVRSTSPQYEAMLKRAETADRRQWRRVENSDDIWVSYDWFFGPVAAPKGMSKASLTDEQLRKLYPAVTRETPAEERA